MLSPGRETEVGGGGGISGIKTSEGAQPGGAPVLSVERLALVFEALKAREDAERGARAPLIFNVDLKNKRKSHDLKDLYKRPLTRPHPSPPDPPWTRTRSRTTSACWLLSFFYVILFLLSFSLRRFVSSHSAIFGLSRLLALSRPPSERDSRRREKETSDGRSVRNSPPFPRPRTRTPNSVCIYKMCIQNVKYTHTQKNKTKPNVGLSHTHAHTHTDILRPAYEGNNVCC